MSPPSDSASTYALETGAADQQRLALLNRYYNPGSLRFLRAVDVSAFEAVLDVGCGQGQMAHLIASAVGSSSTVVGVDASEAQLEQARATNPHPNRCRFVQARADALTEVGGPFDLVYSRFLLQHVGDPVAVLRAMADVLAPGGLLVVEDALTTVVRFVPERPVVEGGPEWYIQLGAHTGASPLFPEQMPLAVRRLGLAVERFESHQPVSFDREAMLLHLIGTQQVFRGAVAAGIASQADTERQLQTLQAAYDDPDTYIELYRVLQVAARKPG